MIQEDSQKTKGHERSARVSDPAETPDRRSPGTILSELFRNPELTKGVEPCLPRYRHRRL